MLVNCCLTVMKAMVLEAAQSQAPIMSTWNFCFSFNATGPLWKFSHKIKYHEYTCHPIWRSSKITSLYFINIRKQRFLILHIYSLCLFPPATKSSLPNVRGQESEWHECIIYEGNTQYNMNLSKRIKKLGLVGRLWPPALPFSDCWSPLFQGPTSVFFPPLSSEAWIASFKLCVISEALLSTNSLTSSGAENYARGEVHTVPFPHPLQFSVKVVLIEK